MNRTSKRYLQGQESGDGGLRKEAVEGNAPLQTLVVGGYCSVDPVSRGGGDEGRSEATWYRLAKMEQMRVDKRRPAQFIRIFVPFYKLQLFNFWVEFVLCIMITKISGFYIFEFCSNKIMPRQFLVSFLVGYFLVVKVLVLLTLYLKYVLSLAYKFVILFNFFGCLS